MDVNAVNNLKHKFVQDFNKFINFLYKGHKKDYTFLLREVCVIENPDYFDTNIYEYLMSHE